MTNILKTLLVILSFYSTVNAASISRGTKPMEDANDDSRAFALHVTPMLRELRSVGEDHSKMKDTLINLARAFCPLPEQTLRPATWQDMEYAEALCAFSALYNSLKNKGGPVLENNVHKDIVSTIIDKNTLNIRFLNVKYLSSYTCMIGNACNRTLLHDQYQIKYVKEWLDYVDEIMKKRNSSLYSFGMLSSSRDDKESNIKNQIDSWAKQFPGCIITRKDTPTGTTLSMNRTLTSSSSFDTTSFSVTL